jgi:hypothetical protein
VALFEDFVNLNLRAKGVKYWVTILPQIVKNTSTATIVSLIAVVFGRKYNVCWKKLERVTIA